MWFYSLVFLLLVAFNGTAYLYNFSKAAYFISLFFLMIMAAFRPPECCADYHTYVDYYYTLDNLPLTFLEPTYFAISYLSKILFNDTIGIFIVYSILGVGLKGLAIQKLTKYYPVSLLLYFGSFFFCTK